MPTKRNRAKTSDPTPQNTAPVEETVIAEAGVPKILPQNIVTYRVRQQVRLIKDIRGVKAGAHAVVEGHSAGKYKISHRGRMYWVNTDDLEAV